MFQLKEFHFQFIPKMKYFVLASLIAVAGSVGLIASKGFNLGTDFKGGVKLLYRFSVPVTEGEIRKIVEPLQLGDLSVQKMGDPGEHRIVLKIEKQPEIESLSTKIGEQLGRAGLQGFTLEQEETVGPKAGADLRKKATLAILVSWLLMLIYIGYRFDFSFAPGAIVSLIHDVLITLGAFAISGREVGLTIVAALLTIVGYSVNDTIVIYDRIRENIPKMPKAPLGEVVNRSLNETLSRTIITNFTVFLVVILIYLFGEGEFQDFGFAMIIGAISGTYSTIFIASPCYLFLKEIYPSLRQRWKK